MSATAFVLWLCVSVDPRPLPRAAPQLPPSNLKVNVLAREDLDSDHLRALARPQVVLWLSTKSNVLSESVLTSLSRFDEAWVQLKSPFEPSHFAQLEQLPRVGLWVSAAELAGKGAGRLKSPRRLAVSLEGPLDEAMAAKLEAVRPAWILWSHSGPVDVLTWSQFKQLPGKKLYRPETEQLTRTDCGVRGDAREPAAWVHVTLLMALAGDVFPCGKGGWVQLEPSSDPWIALSLLARDPSTELVFDVGAAEDRSVATRRALDAL
ncbi:MAG TPA: hypothetical protein VLV15_08345, partial [Dongiaceae bacterium]|nr:hypothetical protein [Dongiaceae bacterium]